MSQNPAGTDKTIELAPLYYLENFEALLKFVLNLYDDILPDDDKELIKNFLNLPENARCIFIRMFNRKSEVFRLEKFNYAEIVDIEAGLATLEAQSFISYLSQADHDLTPEVLRLFTKPELLAQLKAAELYHPDLSKLSKPELHERLLTSEFTQEFYDYLVTHNKVVKHHYVREFSFLRFLYFGNLHTTMSEFVIKDIGNAKFNEFDAKDIAPRFKSYTEAISRFEALDIYEVFRLIREDLEPLELYNWVKRINFAGSEIESQKIYDKLYARAGALLEKAKFFTEALEIYLKAEHDLERERIVRLAKKLNQAQLVEEYTREIKLAPKNYTELIFANDQGGKLKAVTSKLKQADQIEIEFEANARVEKQALAYFKRLGYKGLHSENWIWNASFGLCFWDIIYLDGIHNPLQRYPEDLYTPEFVVRRQAQIDERLNKLRDKGFLQDLIAENLRVKENMLNPFVSWHPELSNSLISFTNHLSSLALVEIYAEMLKNLRDHTKGFPDLFVFNNASYFFVEVKSPRDKLSAQQLFWQEKFAELGIPVQVLKLKYV